MIKDTKRIMLLIITSKKLMFIQKLCQFISVEAFFVPELLLLDFKQFSTILHYSVMTQMILAFINTFQILNVNLIMNLKFKTRSN